MSEYVRVASIEEISPGGAKMVEAGGKKLAVFNVEGTCYAIDETCTHRGGPLSEGTFDGQQITCPWHGAVFDVTSGAVLRAPGPRGVESYKVRVRDGQVEVEV